MMPLGLCALIYCISRVLLKLHGIDVVFSGFGKCL